MSRDLKKTEMCRYMGEGYSQREAIGHTKGPEERVGLASLRNSEEASVSRMERKWGKLVRTGVKNITREQSCRMS